MLIFVIYTLLFVTINFSKSEKVSRIVAILQERGSINSLLTNVFLIAMITLFIACQSNEIAQNQVEIENRESAPAISLTQAGSDYILKNDKGIASYVNFCSYEQYNFIYNGEAYEIRLTTDYKEKDNKLHFNNNCQKLRFEPPNDTFDRDLAFNIICDHLKEKTNEDISPATTRILELNFYDYKNELRVFEYSEYDNKISLSNTNTHYAPDNNITVYIGANDMLDHEITYAIDYLL